MYMYMYIHTYTYTCMCVYTYIYIYIYIGLVTGHSGSLVDALWVGVGVKSPSLVKT